MYAYTDQNYIEAGINFLQKQYDLKEMSYDKIALKQTIALYDLDDNITAKIMVVDRDSELDYVILDFVADDIIAFGFNSKTYLQNFYEHEKVYYLGMPYSHEQKALDNHAP